jgi:adenosylmethionine-8-amino-7-oxononanoate aminotransferase
LSRCKALLEMVGLPVRIFAKNTQIFAPSMASYLIFDEVITGFGRLGANFGAQRFGVTPDMITFAKAITNGVIPMGGVIVREEIYNTIMQSGGQEQMIEFFMGTLILDTLCQLQLLMRCSIS